MKPFVVAALLALCGCVTGEPDDWGFGARFAESATDAQRAQAYARIEQAGGVVETTADLPTSHFGGRSLTEEACLEVERWIAEQPYVDAIVQPCRNGLPA